VVAIDPDDPRVADRAAADVSAQILDGAGAIAEGLEMHAPVLVPHARINKRRMATGVVLFISYLITSPQTSSKKVFQEGFSRRDDSREGTTLEKGRLSRRDDSREGTVTC
jgi:hypothetical protein